MKIKTIGLFALLIFAGVQEASAQFKPKTLRVSVYNEALTMPTLKLIRKPFNPAINVGADFWIKDKNHWQHTLGADLTFYHHKLGENAIMLDGIYSLGYKFDSGFKPKVMAAVGYKHSFLPGEVYKFEDGQYKKIVDAGFAQVNIKLGLGLEYELNEKYSLTTDYKMMMATPYSESLRFSIHSFIGMGVKYNFESK